MKEPNPTVSRHQISLLRAGNEGAFRSVFLNYQPRLFRFIWLRLRMTEVAEDLVQETFLRLWHTRKRLKPHKNFEIYLFKIASNLTIDYLRKRQRRPQILEPADTLTSSDPNPETALFAGQTAELVTQVITNLPERQRTAFALSRFEGFSHKEIATIMEISIKTVEKHMGSALETLRKELKSSGII